MQLRVVAADSQEEPLPLDPIWRGIRAEAWVEAEKDPDLRPWLQQLILASESLEQAFSAVLAQKLHTEYLKPDRFQALFLEAVAAHPSIGEAIRIDLQAVRDRDPAAGGLLTPLLFFKGFQGLQAYRLAHWLWHRDQRLLAVALQNRISEVYGMDIHPAARIGTGVLIDHATGVVIGETAIVENDVSILHEVTLGGTGKETGDRHPKVRRGVLIGAGAKILGNVEVGEGARVGAGSVVLDPVPPYSTVAGVPSRVVSRYGNRMAAMEMDQQFPHHLHADGGGI